MRVTIRRWRQEDALALQALADDPDVVRWMSGFTLPYTLERARRWLATASAQEPAQYFAIESDGALAGGAGIEPRGDTHRGVATVGYWLGKPYWGRGIATAALELLVERAFEAGFRRVEASVFAPNVASARVLEKCGFEMEGRLRASYVDRDGTPRDEFIFGLLNPALRS